MKTDIKVAHQLLIDEMDRQGVTDNSLRAGIAAIAMGESMLDPHSEVPYGNTPNSRIRAVFKTRCSALSDSFLDDLKADPVKFFEWVYNYPGNQLGNNSPGDGYKYRGRTVLQLTGRGNYTKLEQMTGYPIIADPDLANDPKVSAAIAVAYMRWRYKAGSGWEGMLAAVGNNTPDIATTKNRYYQQFRASGEFNYVGRPLVPRDAPADSRPPPAGPMPKTDPEPVIAAFYLAAFNLQSFLRSKQLYAGALDSDIGEGSRKGLFEYLRTRS